MALFTPIVDASGTIKPCPGFPWISRDCLDPGGPDGVRLALTINTSDSSKHSDSWSRDGDKLLQVSHVFFTRLFLVPQRVANRLDFLAEDVSIKLIHP